jgi:UDP-2,4-diacetamido-2,4,6-trideoxy-beta-L-altropyranose hydrolase
MILIDCRASAQVGFGHLIRARALADHAALMGVSSVIYGPSQALMEEEDKTRFINWLPSDEIYPASSHPKAQALIEIAQKFGIRHAILDNYTYSAVEQMKLHEAGLRVLMQYDASAPPMFGVDLVVNASPAERAELHTARVMRDGVQFLNGPKFAVLRPSFNNIKKKQVGRPVRRILVTFGGGDDRGGILIVIRALANVLPKEIELVVMAGKNNPNVKEIQKLINTLDRTKVLLELSPQEPWNLIASCDMAIMAGGTSVYEAAFCGLPMILISIAKNQVSQCQGWQEIGAARYLGSIVDCRDNTLLRAVEDIISYQDRRTEMSQKGVSNVDCLGASRVLSALLELN